MHNESELKRIRCAKTWEENIIFPAITAHNRSLNLCSQVAGIWRGLSVTKTMVEGGNRGCPVAVVSGLGARRCAKDLVKGLGTNFQ